jgi:nucleoside-diphosphate-sugar epimerase
MVSQLSSKVILLTGTKEQRVSLVHVTDLATALVAAAEGAGNAGEVYELDDGHEGGYRLIELATMASGSKKWRLGVIFLPLQLVKLAGYASAMWSRITGNAQILTPGKVRELYHSDWAAGKPNFSETGMWQPTIQFTEGFAATLRWYREHGWLRGR